MGLKVRLSSPKPRRNFFRFLWDNIFRGIYHLKTKFKYFVLIGGLLSLAQSSQAAIRIRAMNFDAPNSTAAFFIVQISSGIQLPDGTTVYILTDGTADQHLFTDGFGNWGWVTAGGGDNLGSHAATKTLTANFGISGTTVVLTYTAIEADDHVFKMIINADGFPDIKALEIDYISGALAANSDEAIMLFNIDESLSIGGDIVALEVLSTEGNAKVIGLELGPVVNPIMQLSGTFDDMDSALVVGTDRLAEFISTGSDIEMFSVDNDSVTIGNTAKFTDIAFLLATVASGGGIDPKFEYSTGIDTWATFTPTDGTDGMKNTGVIQWILGNIPSWATGLGSEFLISITRERNTLTTPPVEDKVQISVTAEFDWDKNGDVHINSITTQEYGMFKGSASVVGDFGVGDVASNQGLFYNSSNDRFGISVGAGSPNAKLEIQGAVDFGGENKLNAIFKANVGGALAIRIQANTDDNALIQLAVGNAVVKSTIKQIGDPTDALTGGIAFKVKDNTNRAVVISSHSGLYIYNWALAEPTAIANASVLYSTDNAGGTSELFVKDEAGNITQLSSHNFDLFDPDPSGTLPISKYYCNEFTGECVGIDLISVVTDLEILLRKKYIYHATIDRKDWDLEQEKQAQLRERQIRVWDATTDEHKILNPIRPKRYVKQNPPQWLNDRLRFKGYR